MNILCDFVGHLDLYYSFHLLFEKRLGWKLYTPHGKGWNDINLVGIPDDASIQNQKNGITHIKWSNHPLVLYGITFNKFKSMKFDLIITTSWENELVLFELSKSFSNEKFIRHIANIHELPKYATNVLLSTKTKMSNGVNWITYHPEHSEQYKPLDIKQESREINSFYNFIKSTPVDYNLFKTIKNNLRDYAFKNYGLDCEYPLVLQTELYKKMQNSLFVWHTKGGGCCGYVARQALACGKPLIVNKEYCKIHQTLASDYLIDEYNCIDVNCRSVIEICNLIRKWSEPNIYEIKSNNAVNTFRDICSFEKESILIKEWILSLLK